MFSVWVFFNRYIAFEKKKKEKKGTVFRFSRSMFFFFINEKKNLYRSSRLKIPSNSSLFLPPSFSVKHSVVSVRLIFLFFFFLKKKRLNFSFGFNG